MGKKHYGGGGTRRIVNDIDVRGYLNQSYFFLFHSPYYFGTLQGFIALIMQT